MFLVNHKFVTIIERIYNKTVASELLLHKNVLFALCKFHTNQCQQKVTKNHTQDIERPTLRVLFEIISRAMQIYIDTLFDVKYFVQI